MSGTPPTCAKCVRRLSARWGSIEAVGQLSLLALSSTNVRLESICSALASIAEQHAGILPITATAAAAPTPAPSPVVMEGERATVDLPSLSGTETDDEAATSPYTLADGPPASNDHRRIDDEPDTDHHVPTPDDSAAEWEGRLRPWIFSQPDAEWGPDDLRTLVSTYAMRGPAGDVPRGPARGRIRLGARRSSAPAESPSEPPAAATMESLSPFALEEPVITLHTRRSRQSEYPFPPLTRSSITSRMVGVAAFVALLGLYGRSLSPHDLSLVSAGAASAPLVEATMSQLGEVTRIGDVAPTAMETATPSAMEIDPPQVFGPPSPTTITASVTQPAPTKVASHAAAARAEQRYDSEAISRLADRALAAGDTARAEALFTEVLAMNPNYVPARVSHADILWAKGNIAGARAAYRHILADVPDELVPPHVRVRALDGSPGRSSLL